MDDKQKNLLRGLLKKAEELQEENVYIKDLAEQYTKSKGHNYLPARSIALDLHIRLERLVSGVIIILLDKGLREFGSTIRTSSYSKHIVTMPFQRKLDLLKSMRFFSRETLETLKITNTVRNAFAHGDPSNSPRYLYRNTSIFIRSGIDKLCKDYRNVVKDYVEKITEGAEIEKE